MTDLSLPAELSAALQSIQGSAVPHTETLLPSLRESAVEWQKNRIRQDVPKQVMDYAEAFNIFRDMWHERVQNLGKEFTVAQSNKKHVIDLVKWAIYDPTSTIPLEKSIWLYGLVGSGKSVLAETFHDFFDWMSENVRQVNWDYHDMNLLIAKAAFDHNELKALNVRKSLIIDELKESQQQVVLPYGMKFKIGDLISTLYSVWQKSNVRSFVTTNLPPVKGDVFDSREFDRMTEMFRSIEWHGASLRSGKTINP